MRSGFFRRASTGAATGVGVVSVRNLLAEFVVVVAGILVALGIDNWRQHRQEVRMVSEHLSDVALEVHGNLWTVERVQSSLETKRHALEIVIEFLKNEPGGIDEDPEKVLQAFAVSARTLVPWLRDNQFQALQKDLSEILCVRRGSRAACGEAVAVHHSELAHGGFPVVGGSYLVGEHVA